MRILLAAFKQETATFNPARSTREHFEIVRGKDLLALGDTRSELGGALTRLAEAGVEVVPTYAAWAVSGGPVDDGELDALIDEARQTLDRDTRLELTSAAQETWMNDAPWIVVAYPRTFEAMAPNIEGWVPHPDDHERWYDLRLEQ